jgi:hypothetical protein
MTTRPMGAELFLCGRTDGHDDAYTYIYIYTFPDISLMVTLSSVEPILGR